MNTIEKMYRDNEIKLSEEQRNFLTYSNPLLVPCSMNKIDENVEFSFIVDDLISSENVIKLSKSEKLRCLINCFQLLKLRNTYSFSLNPENIVFDVNLCPKVIERSVQDKQNDFANEYKALIGYILNPKYKYEDYYLGGKDLYKKKSILNKLKSIDTTDEIKEYLQSEYQNELEYIKKNKVLCNKSNVIATRIIVPLISIAFVLICVKGYFVILVDGPFNNNLVKCANSYIAEDYISTQSALREYDCSKIPTEEKYMLTKAYIITEDLTNAQKENVLSGITLKTDERVFCYWIELGRLDFDKSTDYAKQLGDDELLMLSLIKHSVYVKNDTTITGEEKTTLLDSLEKQITSLKKEMEQDTEDLNASKAS